MTYKRVHGVMMCQIRGLHTLECDTAHQKKKNRKDRGISRQTPTTPVGSTRDIVKYLYERSEGTLLVHEDEALRGRTRNHICIQKNTK